MNDEYVRGFIALRIPDEIKDNILSVITELQQNPINVKWVKRENLHITLKFLGNVQKEQFSAIGDELAAKFAHLAPLALTLNKIGYFGSPNRVKVIWIGLDGEVDKLTAVAGAIEKVTLNYGFKRRGRAFSPHLTIGRVKERRTTAHMAAAIENMHPERLKFQAEQILLVQSDLQPTGPIYTNLKIIKL